MERLGVSKDVTNDIFNMGSGAAWRSANTRAAKDDNDYGEHADRDYQDFINNEERVKNS